MTETAYTGPIFFVGGAPRSGTTVTHALICSSERMCDYHPEISYVTPMVRAYTIGLNNWDGHTSAFFAQREHFRLHMNGLVGQSFSHIHRALGQPEMLCLKDPLLTPYFPRLQELMGQRARFITVIRHPYDVIRSRQEVARKAHKEFDANLARAVAREYMQSYRHIDNPGFGDSLIHFRYEDLLSDQVLAGLRAFTGCDDISPENVWGARRQAATNTGDTAAKDPWFSPKYHGAIDLSSRLSPLASEFQAIANDICGPLMKRFGY